MTRKTRLVDCNPRWTCFTGRDTDPVDALIFDCPEGHEGCHHTIPFTPSLDGAQRPVLQRNGVQWQRTGDTFETLTLSPSIRRLPSYPNMNAAIAAGCSPAYITPTLFCALHIFVRDGMIEFCGDSR